MIALLSRWPVLGPVILGVLFVLGFESVAYAVSTTDIIEALKYTYSSPERIAYLASTELALWNILKRKPLNVGGRGQDLMPIRTKNAGLWRGITQAGTLPTDRAQADTQEASYALQEFYGAIDVSWKLLQDANKSEFAFQNALDFVEDAFRTRMFRLINADLMGHGRGELGILSAADNQTEITVRAMPLVDVGMLVDLMDASDDDALVGPDNTAVTAVDVINNTITTGTAGSGTAAGDYFTVGNSVSTANGSLHTVGLLNWIDDANPVSVVGNLGGINRSTAGNDFWKATVLANSGTNRPLTEDLLLQGFDSVRKRGGKPVNVLMSNLSIIRRYHEVLREDVFFALASVKGLEDGAGIGRDESGMKQGENSDGKTIYRFSGVPWHAEPFFDANRIVGFNTEHFWIGHGENETPEVLSKIWDGQIPFFTRTTSAKFDIEYYWQAELISNKPTAAFVVEDIAES